MITIEDSLYLFNDFELNNDLSCDVNEIINEVRFMVEDVCPYSCSWCAVYWYKQQKSNNDLVNLSDYWNNEWALVQNKKLVYDRYLSVDDYNFLSYIFYNFFSTRDVTITWWEALYSKKYVDISKCISDNWMDISVLTKWAWLFWKSISKIEYTDRVIFSLDTLDNFEHFKLNLPLMEEKKAIWFLNNTINSIKEVKSIWKKVTINTVISPYDWDQKFSDIINFCIENDIEDLKFIELDSTDIKEWYIENKFLSFINDYHFSDSFLNDANNISNKKNTFLLLKTKNWNDLKVWTYRLTCAEEHIFNMDKQKNDPFHKKSCEIWENGSITINTTWEIIPCTWNPEWKISLESCIKSRDVIWTINKIKYAINVIKQQNCPII